MCFKSDIKSRRVQRLCGSSPFPCSLQPLKFIVAGRYGSYMRSAMECRGQGHGADPADVLFECFNIFDSVEALTNCSFDCQDGGRVESDYSKPSPPLAEHQQTIGRASKLLCITILYSAKKHPMEEEKRNNPVRAQELLAEALYNQSLGTEGPEDLAAARAVVAHALSLFTTRTRKIVDGSASHCIEP